MICKAVVVWPVGRFWKRRYQETMKGDEEELVGRVEMYLVCRWWTWALSLYAVSGW